MASYPSCRVQRSVLDEAHPPCRAQRGALSAPRLTRHVRHAESNAARLAPARRAALNEVLELSVFTLKNGKIKDFDGNGEAHLEVFRRKIEAARMPLGAMRAVVRRRAQSSFSSSAWQPSNTSRQVASKLPVYQGSATSFGRSVQSSRRLTLPSESCLRMRMRLRRFSPSI